MSVGHLARRWWGSLRPKAITATERTWIEAQLLPGELTLWERMSTADQRHSYIVGQRAQGFLGAEATRPLLAAAILHDIGKIEANVGTMLRVVATLAGSTATREQRRSWESDTGWLGRAAVYLRHNEIGEELLIAAGSDPLTSTWAREHELPESEWTLPEAVTDALKRADNI